MAIDVQDACNLSGVVHSFAHSVMPALWEEAHRLGEGTDYVNEQAIVTMFLDKMASLNHTQCLCSDNVRNFSRAYSAVQKLAHPDMAKAG